jgi:hypothetical protein
MSKGLSRYQRAILHELERKGTLNIIQVCTILAYIHVKEKDASAEPNLIWLQPEPYSLDLFSPQAAYRMMRSLEQRGLVARLLHRRPAVWYGVEWHDGLPKLKLDSMRDWLDYNTVIDKGGRIQIRTKSQIWTKCFPKPTHSQLRQQERQEQWKFMRSINSRIRKEEVRS